MKILFWRRLAQSAVALAFVAVPVLNTLEINHLSGNFLSFNFAGLPLADPLAVAQAAAGSGAATQAMFVGAGVALLLAAVMGAVFCSWICPFGLLSELTHPKRPGGFDSKTLPAVSSRPFLLKLGLVAAGLALVVTLAPVPFLNQLSMPGWYSRALQHAALYKEVLWGAALCIPLVLLLERGCGKRFWCRYCCPQSVLIALSGMLFPRRWRVRFARKRCTCKASDHVCAAVCSLDLQPRSMTAAQRLQCTNCGDCVDACKGRGGALSLGFGGQHEMLAPHSLDDER